MLAAGRGLLIYCWLRIDGFVIDGLVVGGYVLPSRTPDGPGGAGGYFPSINMPSTNHGIFGCFFFLEILVLV